MGVSTSKYDLPSSENESKDAKLDLATKNVFTVEDQMDENGLTDSFKGYGSTNQNGDSRAGIKDVQVSQKKTQNGKANNVLMESQVWNKEQEKYISQAECGLGCWRPSKLQCWAKTLWSFVLLYSPCALWLITLNLYMRTQVTSIERHFRINSSQMGVLLSCNDIGSVVFVLIGSHFGKFVHIPRLLAFSAVVMALSVMSLSLTQVISPTYLTKGDSSDQTNTTKTNASKQQGSSLGQNQGHDQDTTESGQSSEVGIDTVGTHWGYYLSCVVMFVVGALMSYRLSLQTYYIEKNVKQKSHSGLLMGVLITAMVFGSSISLLLGGAMNEMPVDLEDSEMGMFDPRWISAWYLGFFIIGACSLVTSLPVFCLPRHIIHEDNENSIMCCPCKRSEDDNDDDVAKTKDSSSTKEKFESANDKEWMKSKSGEATATHTLLDQIKDWPISLKRVLLYPVICLVLVEWFVTTTSIAGTMAFELKYIQDQFDISAASVSYYLGYAQLATSIVGTFLGGFLITRMNLTTAGMYKFCWGGQFIAIVGAMIFMALDCPSHNIQGFNTFHSNLSTSSSSCSSSDILFVCGKDGRNYISPCVAGCKKTEGLKYKDCYLLDGGSGTVAPGFCEKDCSLFLTFIIIYLILVLAATFTLTPRILMMARTVQFEDQSLVTGLGTLVQTAGYMVGPILFGKIYDLACVLWPVRGGACLLSDKDELRLYFLGIGAIIRGGGMILLTIATIMMHVQQKRRERSDTSEKNNEVCKPGESSSSGKDREDSVADTAAGDMHNDRNSPHDSSLDGEGSSENVDQHSGDSHEGPCYYNRAFEQETPQPN